MNVHNGIGKPSKARETAAGDTGSLKIEKLYWTYQDLAERSSIPQKTLEKWVHFGKLKYPALVKFGRSVRFDPEKVTARLRELGAE